MKETESGDIRCFQDCKRKWAEEDIPCQHPSRICPLQRAARSPGRSAFDEHLALSPADQLSPQWWAVYSVQSTFPSNERGYLYSGAVTAGVSDVLVAHTRFFSPAPALLFSPTLQTQVISAFPPQALLLIPNNC
ncbi:uncharacterized protein An18g01660 [Aspergillus niger]|uniref:Contig An18c0040, genomic contig n=2 Tax=Aspergillus niger TaxID=5061 RepID=E2PSZ0_ASPNC|nr:uncharacterized protein An18g01660 [Aspergillus niger]CAK47238.1 unnamed protein product [Aspergillus niger]